MNVLQKLTRNTIKKSFHLSVWVIEFFSDTKPYKEKLVALRSLPDNTLGKQAANCLDENNLRIVPGYESHDLKHTLLNYKMTAEDEIRMQAFMLGNGNYTIPCFAILTYGVILLPDLWQTLYADFQKGRNSVPISNWTLDEFKEYDLKTLQAQLAKPVIIDNTMFNSKSIAKYGAYSAIAAGIFGMLFCLPFLFSASIADLVGAGFPFVGGAILTVGGLLALSNLARPIAKA